MVHHALTILLCVILVVMSAYGTSIKQPSLKIRRPHLPSNQYIDEIIEPAARNMLDEMRFADIEVPSYIANGKVEGSYSYFPAKAGAPFSAKKSPIVLVHGFDSSFLEFRRLAPILAAQGRDVYAPDILGWGFINHSNVNSFGPQAKLDYVKSFLQQVVKKPCVLLGASLGGAIAINLAVDEPQLVDKVALLNAQVRPYNAQAMI